MVYVVIETQQRKALFSQEKKPGCSLSRGMMGNGFFHLLKLGSPAPQARPSVDSDWLLLAHADSSPSRSRLRPLVIGGFSPRKGGGVASRLLDPCAACHGGDGGSGGAGHRRRGSGLLREGPELRPRSGGHPGGGC